MEMDKNKNDDINEKQNQGGITMKDKKRRRRRKVRSNEKELNTYRKYEKDDEDDDSSCSTYDNGSNESKHHFSDPTSSSSSSESSSEESSDSMDKRRRNFQKTMNVLSANADKNVVDDMQIALLSAMVHSSSEDYKNNDQQAYDFRNVTDMQHDDDDDDKNHIDISMDHSSKVETKTLPMRENIFDLDYNSTSSSGEEEEDEPNFGGKLDNDLTDRKEKIESGLTKKWMKMSDTDDESNDDNIIPADDKVPEEAANKDNDTAIVKPKTENEMDTYEQFKSTEDVALLSQMINFQISEDETKLLQQIINDDNENLQSYNVVEKNNTKKNAFIQKNHSKANHDQRKYLALAGTVKNHLVVERTIVVESAVDAPPLDEGTLLVMELHSNANIETSNEKTFENSVKQQSQIIPLGKIFEAFGPVTRPYYTIRLTLPNSNLFISKSNEKSDIEEKTSKKEKASEPNIIPNSIDIDNDNDDKNESLDEGISDIKNDSSKTQPTLSSKDANSNAMDDTVNEKMCETKDAEISAMEKEEKKSLKSNSNDTSKSTNENHTNDDNSNNQSTSHTNGKDEKQFDPWSKNGIFTLHLKSSPSMQVYYLQTDNLDSYNKKMEFSSTTLTSVIDTNAVIQTSGKGCDASNLYDEELNPNEIDFSDDEEERKSKSASKNRKKKNNERNDTRHNLNGRGKGRGRGRRGGRFFPSSNFYNNQQTQMNGNMIYNGNIQNQGISSFNQVPQPPVNQWQNRGIMQQQQQSNLYQTQQHNATLQYPQQNMQMYSQNSNMNNYNPNYQNFMNQQGIQPIQGHPSLLSYPRQVPPPPPPPPAYPNPSSQPPL